MGEGVPSIPTPPKRPTHPTQNLARSRPVDPSSTPSHKGCRRARTRKRAPFPLFASANPPKYVVFSKEFGIEADFRGD